MGDDSEVGRAMMTGGVGDWLDGGVGDGNGGEAARDEEGGG